MGIIPLFSNLSIVLIKPRCALLQFLVKKITFRHFFFIDPYRVLFILFGNHFSFFEHSRRIYRFIINRKRVEYIQHTDIYQLYFITVFLKSFRSDSF